MSVVACGEEGVGVAALSEQAAMKTLADSATASAKKELVVMFINSLARKKGHYAPFSLNVR
jgi:hypothetical protein